MSDDYLNEWREPGEFHISETTGPEDLQAQLDAAEKRLAKIDRLLAEAKLAEWRQQIIEWAEKPEGQRGQLPAYPQDVKEYQIAEMTSAQKAAREKWIQEMVAAAADVVKKWGLK